MLFLDLYNQLKKGTLYKKTKPVKWKCSGCGYEQTSKSAPEICPVCQAKQGFFHLILQDE
jgi:rubrerythrin